MNRRRMGIFFPIVAAPDRPERRGALLARLGRTTGRLDHIAARGWRSRSGRSRRSHRSSAASSSSARALPQQTAVQNELASGDGVPTRSNAGDSSGGPADAARDPHRPTAHRPGRPDDGRRAVPVDRTVLQYSQRPAWGSGAIRAAAVTIVALGLGFGIGAAITFDHYAREGELPMTPLGFRSLAGARSKALGQSSSPH